MSWSNASCAARADTEFHFPNGPVLAHGAKLEVIDGPARGPRRVPDLGPDDRFLLAGSGLRCFWSFYAESQTGALSYFEPSQAPELSLELWHRGGMKLGARRLIER